MVIFPPRPGEIDGLDAFVTKNAVDLMAQFARPWPQTTKTPNGFDEETKSFGEHFTHVDMENALGPVESADCKLLPKDISFPPLLETSASAGILAGSSLVQYVSEFE